MTFIFTANADTKKSGYNSCERCECFGEISRFSKIIRMILVDARLRTDFDWERYLDQRWDPVEECFVGTNKPFRNPGPNPFSEEPRIFAPVSFYFLFKFVFNQKITYNQGFFSSISISFIFLYN